ncbi:hypothetical protein [Streptomyces acidiscabies]|uniref:C2H2-type domain-containing protein n=1 Tax=Streptomyces acidiscabies TaxID=42234 RepID=A0ABU4LWD0_9ACTN|nr:hypothetical protein [Streptomyces acidiscabies]MDX3020066.1 hypothetical protein [Streptomyces acidiscabies]
MRNRSTKANGFKASPFRRLTRADLPTFDREAKSLVLAAMNIGCVGRISTKGHCILHNNTGGTASVPPNLTSQNRTAQNARADVRRLMAEHHADVPSSDSAQEPRPARETTVAQAFIQYSAEFTAWFDAREDSFPADTPLKVTFDESGRPLFEVIRAAEAKNEAESTPQTREFGYEACRRPFTTAAALGSHRRVHRDHTSSIPPADNADITPATPQKAKHDMPAPTHRTAPDDAAEQPDDPAAVLQRVREALGHDPRITQFEARVAELETEVAQQRQRADEAQARLALIHEAFHA